MPAPVITITSEGISTAGENYTLACTSTVIEGLVDDAVVTISWTDSSGDPVESDVMQSNMTSTLEFDPLLLSHGGQYICNTSIIIPVISAVKRSSEAYNIIIQGRTYFL